MTEDSFFWTTGGAGDGSATYTRSDLSLAHRIIAACSSAEGVAPGYRSECAGSAPGLNTARIAPGGAIVDGIPYDNNANVDVSIPSAVGQGNTRIDRIVLRADWTAQTVRITRIPGVDAASPTPPAITQSSGVIYDVTLYQALVDTSGSVSLTDERVWAIVDRDNVTIEASAGQLRVKDGGISMEKLANGAVSTGKIQAGAITPTELSTGAVTAGKIASGGVSSDIQLADNIVLDTKLRDSAATSVIGRAAGTAGDPADIQATADGTVLKRAGGSLLFGQVSSGELAAGAVTTDNIAANAITTSKIANDAVDYSKVGEKVPQFRQRQGGNAANWSTPGPTSYGPLGIWMQAGVVTITIPNGQYSASQVVTFPMAFANAPIVILSLETYAWMNGIVATIFVDDVILSTGFRAQARLNQAATGNVDCYIHWLAIGPE